MYGSPYTLDLYARYKLNDLYREAERERLAAAVTGNGRSLRVRLADSLYALAALVEGQPRRATHEGAPLAA